MSDSESPQREDDWENEMILILSAFLPPKEVEEMKEVMKSAISEMVLSPNTAILRIQEEFLSRINRLPQNVVDTQLISKFPEIVASSNESSHKRIQEDDIRIASSPSARILNQFLLNSFSKNPNILSLISKGTIPLDVTALFAANPMIHMITTNQQSSNINISAEMILRMTANYIKTTAELQYKPLLQLLLIITRKLENQDILEPTELGYVMSLCRDAWYIKYPELLCLLDDNVRIIRNSESHGDTTIDAKNSTITFVNQKKETKEVLGPLRIEELAITGKIGELCIDMNTAFRVAERQIKIQLG